MTLFEKLGLSVDNPKIKITSLKKENNTFDLFLIRDDSSEVMAVKNLWYQVYIEELAYNLTHCVDPNNKLLHEETNNSVIFTLEKNNETIGSLRISDSKHSDFIFNYQKYLDNSDFQEITKFIFLKEYRKTYLSYQFIINVYFYIQKNIPTNFYVLNSSLDMLRFYENLGFQKISDELIHPVIGNRSFLMKVDVKFFDYVVNKLCEKLA